MKKVGIILSILVLAAVVGYGVVFQKQAKWDGVDESVIKPFAEKAGRTPVDPFINPTGDMLLFVFLLAGIAGGFVGGYYFRELFPPSGRNLRANGNAEPATRNVQPVTCNMQPVTCNMQPVTCNMQPVTCNVQPVPCNVQPVTRNVQPVTCNMQPVTCNVQPVTRNPQDV
ncbi:MAG: hypothetical protein HQK57_13275 [Deltaproteobacteria bacterium]|nr:hypothetical protein [Deltaproteobacteria bacterium]